MAKFIKETYKKENGELVKYPLGADIKNVVITKVDENGNEVIKNTLDKELEIIKQDSSSAAYPSYSIENIEEEGLEKLTKGESISASIRKLYKVTSRFINHLKNITSGENHIPTGGKEGDILLWDSDGQAKWGPDENTTYSNFQGATANDPGKAGLVLAPAAGEQNKFLKGDGTWGSPDNAQYTPGIGISILNNKISLATATITNTNGTNTSGTEVTIPHLIFDEYGRVKNVGTKKHTLPNSTFVGGTLTETLYYGSNKKYFTKTDGDATLSGLKLKSEEAEWRGINFINSLREISLGLTSGGEFWFKANKDDSLPAYKNTAKGKHIFYNTVQLEDLKDTNSNATRVVLAYSGGSLTTSSINSNELYCLNGTTSNIQSQLNAKVNINGSSNIKITKEDDSWASIEFVNSKNSGSVLGVSKSGEFGCYLRPTSAWVKFPTASGTLALNTLSNGTETAGLIKTSSTVTSNSGYTACPVISGVPYYKNTTYSTATKSANGLMSSTMVNQLSKSMTVNSGKSASYKSAGSTNVTLNTHGSAKQLQTLTLTEGLWLVFGGVRFHFSSNYDYKAALIGIHTSASINAYPPGYSRAIGNFSSNSVASLNCQMVYEVSSGSTQQIYLMGQIEENSGGGEMDTEARARLIAIRIPYL